MNKLSTKKFIKEFNFPSPNWGNLPMDFPNLGKDGLTKQEGHLLDGIKLAWIISGGGRKYFYKTVVRRTLVGIATIAVAVLIARNFTAISQRGIAGSVSAKTVVQTVGEIVEATRSAIFK